VTISAADMAEVLSSAVNALFEVEVVQQESLSSIRGVCSRLRSIAKGSDDSAWAYQIPRGDPILFQYATDEDGELIQPIIIAEEIGISIGEHDFPFTAWDIALEIYYLGAERADLAENPVDEENPFSKYVPCARWHSDLANEDQPGPRTHLQYGGHFRGLRQYDSKLKVPRWPFYPLDLVLMSEIVAANFFEERWRELQQNRNWCEAVNKCQKLCLIPYLNRIKGVLDVSTTTVLTSTWNDNWT